jgi:UDP-N-acetylglucosamine transferase subunit ALG13
VSDAPLVLVTVGTDHHPFDRLIHWVDDWLEGSAPEVRCLVQSGTSAPSRAAAWQRYLPYQELQASMREAVAVVCHGGTGTTLGALHLGRVPIVVPRQGALGEHVDDHQVAFARRLQASGDIVVAETEAELHARLDQALRDPAAFRAPALRPRTAEAIRAFEQLVNGLVGEAAAVAEGVTQAEDAPMSDRVRVLYIGGLGRSGSTLLERMLEGVGGCRSVGELAFVWTRGLIGNNLCGCGERFRSCPFWVQVGREAFGGWEHLDPAEVVALQASVDRTRFVPLTWAPFLSPVYRRRLDRYAGLLSALYRAVQRVSGEPVIVDATKHVSHAFLLRRLPELDLRVVHLVRDSRGVAFAWTKVMRRAEVADGEALMATGHPLRLAGRWLIHNLLFHLLRAMGVPSLLVRYETLVRHPRRELARILRHLGRSPEDADLGFVGDGYVDLGSGHALAGNPMRFAQGRLPLRLDEAWRREMRRRHRVLTLATTWPLLLRYGYLTGAADD